MANSSVDGSSYTIGEPAGMNIKTGLYSKTFGLLDTSILIYGVTRSPNVGLPIPEKLGVVMVVYGQVKRREGLRVSITASLVIRQISRLCVLAVIEALNRVKKLIISVS